ncbi:hypothetical protein [Rhodanobacter sp. Root561]|uniref:hypothetical protein n=1 Tax=Rhodanobacter sp. Root561 TaxID=1736560 RepID=UPI00138F77EE|nr:hypothetical protein [Rhodanobacter sp. Root561]
MAVAKQSITQVRAKEASATSDKDSFHGRPLIFDGRGVPEHARSIDASEFCHGWRREVATRLAEWAN